jgi:hypothetical protein
MTDELLNTECEQIFPNRRGASEAINQVHELATVCFLWQQWAETSVWFDDVVYQRFIAVLLLIYDNLFLSGVYYCLSVFWSAVARMSELELEHCL